MLDGGVVGLDFSCGGAGDDEDLGFLPPPAHGPPQPGRFGLLGFLHQFFEVFLGQPGVLRGTGAQQGPYLFLHRPGCLEFPRWVIGGEHAIQPGAGTV